MPASLGLRKNDVVLLRVDIPWTIRHAMRPVTDDYDWPEWASLCGQTFLPFIVHDTFGSSTGKFPKSLKLPVVAEFGPFLRYAAGRLHPYIRANTGTRRCTE